MHFISFKSNLKQLKDLFEYMCATQSEWWYRLYMYLTNFAPLPFS